MSLKLLIIPFSILMVLILMIGFVKPDVALLQEKQVAYATKLDQAKNMDTLLGNINTLISSLNDEQQADQFVMDYFPKTMDEGRVIDAFNFLATQSGVSVGLMDLKEVAMLDQGAEQAPIAGGAGAASVPMTRPAKIKSFSAKVSVKGGYENIKDFFGRASHMNRMHKTWNFSIVTPEKSDSATASADEKGVLQGSFEAAFDYFEPQVSQNALYVPVFSRGAFDMASYTAASSWVTSVVPPLEKPNAGRPNPFQ